MSAQGIWTVRQWLMQIIFFFTLSRKLPNLLRTLLSHQQCEEDALRSFPPFVPGAFQSIVDAEMGF